MISLKHYYPYIDPFNTDGYANILRERGYQAVRLKQTFIYLRQTPLGRVAQVFYPTEPIAIKARLIEMNGLLEPLPNTTLMDYTHTIHVDTQRPLKEIFGSLYKNKRHGIRKALERGAVAYCDDTKSSFEDFWRIYKAGVKRNKIHLVPKTFFERIFSDKQLCKLFLVKAQNVTIGAYMILYSNELARFFYGGFLYPYKDYHPNELAHWKIIEHFNEKGFKMYDMGGAGKSPHSGDFKVGWGKMVKIYRCTFYSSKLLANAIKYYRNTKLTIQKIKGMM